MIVASIKAPDELGPLVGSPGETLTATLKRTITEMILFGLFARDARFYPHELAQRFGVRTVESFDDAALACDVLVLAVKPQQMKAALAPIAGRLGGQLVLHLFILLTLL